MSKTNAFETDLLEWIFNHTSFPVLGPSQTVLWCSLHTSSPGEAGNQSTNEATYTAYARTSVARTTGGWTVTGNSTSPVSNIQFPQATGGSETITHLGVGTSETGAGYLIYYAAVAPNIAVATGVTPDIVSSSTISED